MFIGIDLGTSSVKTILIDSNQKTLASHTESIKLLNPKNGYYEQNPELWVKATFLCFTKIRKQKQKEFEAVESLSISGQMHGATLIDKNLNLLRNCILWNDTRSMKECFEMKKKFGEDKIFKFRRSLCYFCYGSLFACFLAPFFISQSFSRFLGF